MPEITVTEKRCSKCKTTKPVADFHREHATKTGLAQWCRSCVSAKQRRYREANAEKVKAARKKWADENAEYVRQKARDRYRENRAAILAARRERAPEYRRRFRAKDPERTREADRRADLRRHYGIEVEDYERMLAEQGGVCAICQQGCSSGRRLAVDHDHETGVVRGLLCARCNAGIGQLREDPETLRAAIVYLERG